MDRGVCMPRAAWVTKSLGIGTALLVVAGMLFVGAAPAAAANGALNITKTVDGSKSETLVPGQEFTFKIVVGCSDVDCVNAVVTDQLPDSFTGFEIVDAKAYPETGRTVETQNCNPPDVVEPGCSAKVSFDLPLTGGRVGLTAGTSYTLYVVLKVPDNLPPTWPYNGVPLTNTGTAKADNAATVSDDASVTVNIPVTTDTAVTKSWTPTNEQFSPGAQSTVNLTTQNTSNVPADSLVLQEPAVAPDGATTLDPSNPFQYVDFAGLGDVTLPAGATQVQVDAYVYDASTGTYSWVNGDPGPPPGTVPVPDDEVAGIRLTFTDASGAAIDPGGAAGTVPFTVAQRETNRDTGDSLQGGWTTTNQASGTVNVPGHDPVTKDATASHTVTPVNVAVAAAKSFTPEQIPAGTTSIGKITATSNSDGPLETLSISDLDYFTADLQFSGFTAPLSYPPSATTGHITWHYSDDSTSTEDFANQTTPVASPPAGAYVTGFEIVYDGPIDKGVSTSASFGVTPTLDYVTDGEEPITSTNTVVVDGTSGTKSDSSTAKADLTVFAPDIHLDLTKKILPSTPVAPGGTVTAELPTTTDSSTAYVNPTTITVTDVAPTPHDDASLWNAFNPIAIAPTQVPDGATLTVQYTTDDGATWQNEDWCDNLPMTGPNTYACNVLPSLQGSVTGLRFTFTNPDGFGQNVTVQPNITFQARADQRYTDEPTSVPDAGPSVYENVATAQGQGTAGGETITSDPVKDSADASIETHTGGNGSLIVGKRWTDPSNFTTDKSTIDAQSGEKAGTSLSWGVTSTGYASLTVSDPSVSGNGGTPPPAVSTVFQAFNLVAIAPITTTQDPLLKWDTVSRVELFENGAWVPIDPPGGSWMGANGFVGYTLKTAPNDNEQDTTTGVRITVVPNDDARANSHEATTPPVGSGISASSTARHFNLVWTLRNSLRTPVEGNTWVNGSTIYNTVDRGVVNNHEQVDATELDNTPVGPAGADDTITILDRPPGVSVAKTSQKQQIPVPNPGDVPPAQYPTNDFTVTAHSTSLSRASYVRVTDPMPCSSSALGDCTSAADAWGADPYAGYAYGPSNPFDQFNLTGLSFSYNAAEVDPDASQVTLLHRALDGTLTTTTTTISGARAMTVADLADVVGVSVVYQGTDPATKGGTITTGDKLVMVMHTQVREVLRSNPLQFVTPITVSNYSFAQSYDPVLYPSGQGSTPIDTSRADVQLVLGQLAVNAAKTFSPQGLLEANRTAPVTVTLSASQIDSPPAAQADAATIPTNQVTIDDSDQGFWNDFALTSFSASDVTLPAGADQVRVDVQLNGSSDWTLGTAGPTAVLPTSDLAAITGIRFVFDRADGGLFSHTAPPAPFTASAVLHVQLLDTGRDNTAIPFPGTVKDTVTTNSHRTDSDLYPDANGSASASFTLSPGTFSLDVAKDPYKGTHTVSPGSSVPWTITFTNTGTGILTIPTVVDTLPDSLSWDGQAPTYATSAGGTLSTDVTLEFDKASGTLTFSWPASGQRMQPGEKFTITLGIILNPGLHEGERATNSVVVNTDQTLGRNDCTNKSGNGQGTISGVTDTQCGTTNYVTPTPGAAMIATKGVKGDVVDSLVSGAEDPNAPMLPCVADDDGFYHDPCVANTRLGGTDEWRLSVTNSGTVPFNVVTLVDPLPVPGDALLATGSARGSQWKVLADAAFGVQVSAPALATKTIQVSTDPMVCVGDPAHSSWTSDHTCSANTWVDASTYAGSWSAITGMRAIVDMSRVGGLQPGATVSLTARTINEPASASNPQGLSTAVPLPTQYAYDQFGVQATLANGEAPLAQAPVKVGVTPSTGSLLVKKVVTGADASRAPTSFEADVSCQVGDTQLDLGDDAALQLTKADDYEARIDGIPVGAVCDVTEHGDTGSYEEDSRTVSPGSVSILDPSTAADPVPGAQIVTITNTYNVHPVPPAPNPGGLAGTGSNLAGPITVGVLLLGVGALFGLLAWRRRRRA